MATIKLRNVSFNYATPIRKSGLRLFESPQESNEEDLAVEVIQWGESIGFG